MLPPSAVFLMGDIMKWTTGKPTIFGLYWTKMDEHSEAEIARVYGYKTMTLLESFNYDEQEVVNIEDYKYFSHIPEPEET